MNIPFLNLQAEYQSLQSEIDAAIKSVLTSGNFIGGEQVKQFCAEVEQFANVNHFVPCASGTDALQIALMALKIKPGDEVIVPAYTFVSPVECVALLGATPVFVDIDATNYNLDLTGVEEAITPKTKAIIAVHLFGQTVNMEQLLTIANQYKIAVIEDVAQAFGAILNNQFAGTFGTIGTTSFFPSKNLGAYGDGGGLFTNNDSLANQCKVIASHGMYGKKFYHDEVGINSRLDSLQAAILRVKLKYLKQHLAKRKQTAAKYQNELNQIDGFYLPETSEGMDHTFHQYVVQVEEHRRAKFREFLQKNGVATGHYYPHILPELPPYKQAGDFSVAKQLSAQSVALPIHPYLTDDEIDHIVQTILTFFHG